MIRERVEIGCQPTPVVVTGTWSQNTVFVENTGAVTVGLDTTADALEEGGAAEALRLEPGERLTVPHDRDLYATAASPGQLTCYLPGWQQ